MDGTGAAARFNSPYGIAAYGADTLYVTDSANHTVRKIVISTRAVTTIAGVVGVAGFDDNANPLLAHFNSPQGIAVDSTGNIFVVDTGADPTSGNHIIRKIAGETGPVTTEAGLAQTEGSADGVGSDARFNFPSGIAVDSTGQLYIGDQGNHTIRKGSLPAQATLSVSSSATTTFGSPYTATYSGGSGTGAISWALGTGSTATGAAIDATTGAVTSTSTGTVVIKVTKAADANYLVATSADFTITFTTKLTPVITWGAPSAITYPTALSPTQLNATEAASLPGTFVYSPISGTVLGAGTQTLDVTFTPTDTITYNNATARQSLTVNRASQSAPAIDSGTTATYGTPYTATSSSSGFGALIWSSGTGSTAPGSAIEGATGIIDYSAPGTVVIKVRFAGDANHDPSPFSGDFTVTVLQAAQTITFGALSGKTYGDAPFGVSATASSGLTPTFSIFIGPATISGDTVTITGAGDVTVRASQAGDTNYNAATPVDQTFTVAKAAATVTLGSLSATYDGSPHAATATTNPVGKTVTFTYDGSATAPTTVGSYAVIGTISDSNYQGSGSGTLTITPLYHSTDYSRDWRISLPELLRVIALYNYRSGSTRTGDYHVQFGTVDGFDPGPGAAMTVFHSADTGSHDGKISLPELLRVIALYNYRSGSTRTGEYHVQSATVDGFDPGP